MRGSVIVPFIWGMGFAYQLQNALNTRSFPINCRAVSVFFSRQRGCGRVGETAVYEVSVVNRGAWPVGVVKVKCWRVH